MVFFHDPLLSTWILYNVGMSIFTEATVTIAFRHIMKLTHVQCLVFEKLQEKRDAEIYKYLILKHWTPGFKL